jgi:hypothetical protein
MRYTGVAMAQAEKTTPSSVCSLPVVSTVVLEYPLGSPKVTATLKSNPKDVPAVYTGKEELATHTMESIFVALNLSGTFSGKPITSTLNGAFASKGKVENVRHFKKGEVPSARVGEFAGGRHVLEVFQVYTIGTASFFNKDAITLVADIKSTTPTGRTYSKQGANAISLYDRSDPSKVVAKLYSLDNAVQ